MADPAAFYSHRQKFSSYMGVVAEAIGAGGGRSLLDVPAGSGHFADAMAERGFAVTCADVNDDRPDFTFADLNDRLPFDDGAFDVVTCLEGIEHAMSDAHLVGELARVCRPGGMVVISTPNIAHMLSRLRFLFTASFFHFRPLSMRDAPADELVDRWHIMPIYLPRLVYLARHHDLLPVDLRTDRYKSKWLYPLHRVAGWLAGPARRRLFFARHRWAMPEAQRRRYYRLMYSDAALMGRTLIMVFRKQDGSTPG